MDAKEGASALVYDRGNRLMEAMSRYRAARRTHEKDGSPYLDEARAAKKLAEGLAAALGHLIDLNRSEES